MRVELELKLVEKYPKLFKDYGGDMKVTCMAWGCEHDDGWYNILEDLCEKLSHYQDITFAQIKEKFGVLTVYLNSIRDEDYDEVMGLLIRAEEKSSETCEICGAPGELRGGGWLRTLCDECEEKINDRK